MAPIIVAALSAGAVWYARRKGQTWDSDLLPALFGGLGALTILTALHGTPFDVYGLAGDQLFRTESVTRFADTWRDADYTYRGLPGYYAPTYFWVLGRTAALTHIAPWHMLKYGTIGVAFAAPILSYLLWRRVVPARTAALISAVPLLAPGLSETYAWIVLVAFIPWWLQVGHGLTRQGLRRWHPVVLGMIGAVLFTVYYYFFFVVPIVVLLHIVEARLRGRHRWRETGRTVAVLGVTALGSAPYWAPLAWNFLTAPEFESLNNRWITLSSGTPALPMFEPSVVGVLCLIGLVFLVATFIEAISRALLILLVSLYVWHVAGFLLLAVDRPVMSFRMRDLVPILLLSAAAMAVVRATKYAAQNFSPDVAWRLAAAGGVFLTIFAGDRFVNQVLADVKNAHNQTLPDGRLPPFHEADAVAWKSPVARVSQVIDAQYAGTDHPVVLTDRSDLMALYPYYGFVQWNANYSHPTSQFHRRLDFIRELGQSQNPQEFAARVDSNPFDKIDVLVLHYDKDTIEFKFRDDDFPFGTTVREIDFPKNLIQPPYFETTTVEGTLIAVRRPGG